MKNILLIFFVSLFIIGVYFIIIYRNQKQTNKSEDKFMLIIFRLTIKSSFKENLEQPADASYSTIQWWYDGSSLWRIATYAIDHDIHTYQITRVKNKEEAKDFAIKNTNKNYGDVIAEQKIIEFDKPLNQAQVKEIFKTNNMNPNLETSKNFSFWNPDNKKFKTQSKPDFIN